MAAGPIGSVWALGSWEDTAWEAESWADEGPTDTSVLNPILNCQGRVNARQALVLTNLGGSSTGGPRTPIANLRGGVDSSHRLRVVVV